MKPTSASATVDGRAARWIAAPAPPPAPNVVMLHGANGTADTFAPTLDAWAWASVACPDLPGRAGSQGPALDRAEALADWLAALAADQGWASMLLVGHSLGGAVALQVALRHPDARPIPTHTALADWRACDRFDVLPHLARVRCPALVVHGTRDALTPSKHQRALADALPRASRVELDGVGHMLPWEAPAPLSEAVRAWWSAPETHRAPR